MPDVVVFPKNVEEVSAVVRVCNDRYIPVVPFGTGTGLEGGIAAYTVRTPSILKLTRNQFIMFEFIGRCEYRFNGN